MPTIPPNTVLKPAAEEGDFENRRVNQLQVKQELTEEYRRQVLQIWVDRMQVLTRAIQNDLRLLKGGVFFEDPLDSELLVLLDAADKAKLDFLLEQATIDDITSIDSLEARITALEAFHP